LSISINEIINDKIVMYPNPATSILSLSEKCDIVIYSLQNQILLKAINSSDIDISKLIHGSYIIEAKNGKDFSRHIFIKQ